MFKSKKSKEGKAEKGGGKAATKKGASSKKASPKKASKGRGRSAGSGQVQDDDGEESVSRWHKTLIDHMSHSYEPLSSMPFLVGRKAVLFDLTVDSDLEIQRSTLFMAGEQPVKTLSMVSESFTEHADNVRAELGLTDCPGALAAAARDKTEKQRTSSSQKTFRGDSFCRGERCEVKLVQDLAQRLTADARHAFEQWNAEQVPSPFPFSPSPSRHSFALSVPLSNGPTVGVSSSLPSGSSLPRVWPWAVSSTSQPSWKQRPPIRKPMSRMSFELTIKCSP